MDPNVSIKPCVQCVLSGVIIWNMVWEEGQGVFLKQDDVFVQYFLGDELELEQERCNRQDQQDHGITNVYCLASSFGIWCGRRVKVCFRSQMMCLCNTFSETNSS